MNDMMLTARQKVKGYLRGIGIVLLLALGLTGGASAGLSILPPTRRLLPEWYKQPSKTYLRANLYECIDGAADFFLSYGFRELETAIYTRGPENSITIDVYDMGRPLHAFGVFAAERPIDEKGPLTVGQSYESNGLITFWKDNYYVKVSIVEGGDKAAARVLARSIFQYLPDSLLMPTEFERLPAKNRIPGSERFVKKAALGHEFLKEVVNADYQVGVNTARVHVADLGAPRPASSAFAKLRDFERKTSKGWENTSVLYAIAFLASDPEYGSFLGLARGRYVVIVTSEKAAPKELKALAAQTLAGLRTEVKGGKGKSA